MALQRNVMRLTTRACWCDIDGQKPRSPLEMVRVRNSCTRLQYNFYSGMNRIFNTNSVGALIRTGAATLLAAWLLGAQTPPPRPAAPTGGAPSYQRAGQL